MAVASCAGDDARKHVYQSPPPVRATIPSSSARAPSTPEPPIGAAWATAKINSVRLASTGTIASLGDITDSIDVLAMVSRGKGSTSAGPARIELHFAGPTDTTLVETVKAPVPLVVAHVFRVDAAHGPAGLHDGVYRAQLRLIGPDGRVIAQSTQLWLSVRSQ
jgi:hypothetical protein